MATWIVAGARVRIRPLGFRGLPLNGLTTVPPPPNVVSKLRSRFLLPAIAAAAIAALLLVSFDLGTASAQSPPPVRSVHQRTTQVCEALLAKLRTDSDTSAIYGSSGTYPWSNPGRTAIISGFTDTAPSNSGASAPIGLGCTGTGNTVIASTTSLAALDFDYWPRRLNLSNKGINSLAASDFAGLSRLVYVDLGNNNLTTLPGNLFQPTRLGWLSLRNNNISSLPANAFTRTGAATFSTIGSQWTWGPRHGRLDLTNNPLTTLPYNIFDGWTDLRSLWLENTQIGVINTRWFEKLTVLGHTHVDGANNVTHGKASVRFNNMPVAKYQFQETGAATNVVEYFGDATALATAIKLVITTETSTATPVLGVGTPAQVNANTPLATNFIAPGIGINICGQNRSDPVEGEIIASMRLNPNDGLGRGWEHQIGNIRSARWDKTTCDDTTNLPAEWRTIETGELFTGAYSATTHTGAGATVAKGIKRLHAWHTLILDSADILDANGALKPADFENLFNVNYLRLHGIRVKDIPADTFKHMPNLVELRIMDGQLEDDDFTGSDSFLQHFKNLKTLWIPGNLLTEFDASTHLPANVRNTLESLHIQYNPIKETDLDGLDLKDLRIQGTRITTLDPAIRDMDQLEQFWWRNSFLTNEGIDPNSDPASFFADFPATLTISEHTEELGNPFHSTDPVIQAAAVQTQLDHAARMKAINDADPGNDLVKDRFLGDPCRPDIGAFDTFDEWANGGELCLTGAQISDWVASLDSFNGLNTVRSLNLDLSDAQTGALLENLEGKPLTYLSIKGAENAFGTGFDDSKLDAFSSFGSLSQLQIRGTAITHQQVKTILDKLAEAFIAADSASEHDGLFNLNLRNNPNLFAGATAASVAGFLDDVAIKRDNSWSDFWLLIRETGLTFPVLKALVDSIDEELQLRALDVSQNPGLWTHADATDPAITALFTRLKGADYINVGNTGMTAAQAKLMFDALGGNGGTELGTDGGAGVATTKHTLARTAVLGIEGIDLSDSGLDLNTEFFAKFAGRYTTSAGVLRSLSLSGTSIDLDGLNEIVDGLVAASNLHQAVRTLSLDQSGELWASVDPTEPTELAALTTLFAKFSNLRSISIEEASLPADPTATPPTPAKHFTLAHLNAVLDGLDRADGDGTTTDGVLATMADIDVRGNPQLFAPLEGESAADHAARLAPVFAKARHAELRITNTGLTQPQLAAIVAANADLLEQLREGGAVEMTSTPPPKSAMIHSGRRSIQIAFTHEPRALSDGGATIRATGYEYRYRAVPADTNAPWMELWRTLTLDLALGTASSKDFSFNIHGLDPETAYQVQIRATGGTANTGMTAASSAVLIRGGTILDLPQINSISPEVTEVSVRAGDTIRLSVKVFGLADQHDNDLGNAADSDLIFRWSETSTNTGGSFADPNHERRVIYTAPGLPGTYTVMAEAQPDGVCRDHHATDFGITDADRADCQATVTVHVSRAADTAEPPKDPINPGGLIPTSLTDNDGTAYAVFLPVEGGTFSGEGITVSAQPGAVPDLTFVGIAAGAAGAVPAPTPGSRMTLAGSFFDINALNRNGAAPLTGYTFDDPISACLPLPTAFRGNVSDVVLVEQKSDGSLGILATKIRQTAGTLSVCGSLTNLPATVAVAKLGTVPPPPPEPDTGTGDELPDTGATTPYGAPWSLWAILLAATALLLATTAYTTRGRRTTRRTN